MENEYEGLGICLLQKEIVKNRARAASDFVPIDGMCGYFSGNDAGRAEYGAAWDDSIRKRKKAAVEALKASRIFKISARKTIFFRHRNVSYMLSGNEVRHRANEPPSGRED